jgi:hypothetical protein
MDLIPDNIIKEIAEELEVGMRVVYFNKETFKIITIPGEDDYMEDEFKELFKDELKELKRHKNKYIEIENMDSSDSFKIMEGFVYGIEDDKIKERFLRAINRPKPFTNFRYELDFHDELKDAWYKFKEQRTIEWVKRELGIMLEDD